MGRGAGSEHCPQVKLAQNSLSPLRFLVQTPRLICSRCLRNQLWSLPCLWDRTQKDTAGKDTDHGVCRPWDLLDKALSKVVNLSGPVSLSAGTVTTASVVGKVQ